MDYLSEAVKDYRKEATNRIPKERRKRKTYNLPCYTTLSKQQIWWFNFLIDQIDLEKLAEDLLIMYGDLCVDFGLKDYDEEMPNRVLRAAQILGRAATDTNNTGKMWELADHLGELLAEAEITVAEAEQLVAVLEKMRSNQKT